MPLLLALAACAPKGGGPEPRTYSYPVKPGEVLDLVQGRVLPPAELGPRLAQARLVFLGEQHDELGSHRFQAQAIRDLIAQGREVYVALEMFPPTVNDVLADWSRGKLEERDFIERSGWYEHWGFPWADYRDLFVLFRDQHLPVRGINVTREQRRMASQGKYPPELKAEVGDLDLGVAPQKHFLSDALNEGGHGEKPFKVDTPEFDRFLRIQVLWDHVMGTRAANLTKVGSNRQVVVVLIGAGHLAYKLGANLRAARVRPEIPQLTVLDRYVQRQSLGPAGTVEIPVGMSDLVRVDVLTDESKKPATLATLKLSAAEGGIRVDGISIAAPKSLRAFKTGDLIQSLNGKGFTDPVDLRLAYETFPPTGTAHWMVLRDGMPVPMDLPVKHLDE